jgi:hypothetical protein
MRSLFFISTFGFQWNVFLPPSLFSNHRMSMRTRYLCHQRISPTTNRKPTNIQKLIFGLNGTSMRIPGQTTAKKIATSTAKIPHDMLLHLGLCPTVAMASRPIAVSGSLSKCLGIPLLYLKKPILYVYLTPAHVFGGCFGGFKYCLSIPTQTTQYHSLLFPQISHRLTVLDSRLRGNDMRAGRLRGAKPLFLYPSPSP